MKKILIAVGLLVLGTGPASAQGDDFTNDTARRSYAIGQNMGAGIEASGIDVDVEQLLAGLRDSLSGQGRLSEEQVSAELGQLQQEIVAQQRARSEVLGAENQKAAEAYFASNGQRSEVTTTASGLQYEVLTMGDGPKPAATDRVRVHYTGTLLDGTKFDSSVDRGTPAIFAVNQVISGWTEGLQLMPVGSKWKLHIPSELGYGPQGRPPQIGPSAALVFEVELLAIESSE